MEQSSLEPILEGSKQPMHLPLETLQEITDKLSMDRIIGEGGFGTVCKTDRVDEVHLTAVCEEPCKEKLMEEKLYQPQHSKPLPWEDKSASESSSEHDQSEYTQEQIDELLWQAGYKVEEECEASWEDEFQDLLSASEQSTGAFRGVYVFSEMNPYAGHPNPMQEGQELFRKGLLNEAALALEAEVSKNPDNADGWRLLGVTHAENDDDKQAIAALLRGEEAHPTNLEILLALGVSLTNELEEREAFIYLLRWLQNHPKYGGPARPHSTDTPNFPYVIRLFNEAAEMCPEDADVHIVLGVLYNLTSEHDKAIASFKAALQLKPQDYSLWNKLGATQANGGHSDAAAMAYQKALFLRSNYVRAWTNMGVCHANQGMHESSIPYYVYAISMNPKVDNAWLYMKTSLSQTCRSDMIAACDSRNLDVLQREFPKPGILTLEAHPEGTLSESSILTLQPDQP